MSDRPILFSAPMVRSLLAGTKTQTRRILKPQLVCHSHADWPDRPDPAPVIDPDGLHCAICGAGLSLSKRRPSGVAGIPVRFRKGDRLYVREAWAEVGSMDPGLFITRADYPACVPRHYENVPHADEVKWRPGIYMPRARSRLTLTVTDVRVQRLQEITPADAIAEGIAPRANSMTIDCDTPDPRDGFKSLWASINGAGSWAANPWVVAVSFTVERRNIDA